MLGPRLGTAAVQRRLRSEGSEGKPIAGRSSPFSYFEEWVLGPLLLRNALRVSGLYARGLANALDIRIGHNEFESKRLPLAMNDLKVLQLSDLHIDVSQEFEDALLQTTGSVEDYDLCVITGDLRFHTHGEARPTLAAMRRLRAVLKKRCLLVLGNHDSLRWVPALEDAGYEVLINEATAFEHSGEKLWVVGVDDAGYFGASDLATAGMGVPDDACRLLLSHSPEIVRDTRLEAYDFVLCGHSHGGQINLPGGWPPVTNSRCARRFCKGRWRKGRVQGYTTHGAGTSMLNVRFNCPPEITVHHLRCGG